MHLYNSTQKFADLPKCAASTWEAFEEHLGEFLEHEEEQAEAVQEAREKALAKTGEIYAVLEDKLGEE